MADSSKSGRRETGAGSPQIRLNSSKVSQLEDLEDSLVDMPENSRFSQWRRQSARLRQEKAQQKPENQGELERDGEDRPSPGRPRWRIWVYSLLALLVSAALFVGLVFFSPLLATQNIRVQGASLLDAQEVKSRLSSLEGVPMTRISQEQVASLIGQESLLYGVSLQAQPPHDLLVILHERVPVALIQEGDSFLLVDNEGVTLGKLGSRDEAKLPLLEGGPELLEQPAFATVTQVLASLPTSVLSDLDKAQADSASTITLTMTDGTMVVWGTPEESDLKAKVLLQLMDSVGSEVKVETYDVSSPLIPTVK